MKSQIPETVINWLSEKGEGEADTLTPVSGGSINQAFRLTTINNSKYFLKMNDHCPSDMFPQEAEGLKMLEISSGPRVPKVLLVGEKFLLLEEISDIVKTKTYWTDFGHQLASVHRISNPEFGLAENNYIGSTPQSNHQNEDGFEFFANQRLIFQAELARKRDLLSSTDFNLVKNLTSKLKDLIPTQTASLIHGDLWGGNLITGPKGEPVIIDPAAHFGWPEAELAMTTLFGSFPIEFYKSYEESSTIESDWRQRIDLYNLYHLLNHLNIFGMSYHGSVVKIIKKFG